MIKENYIQFKNALSKNEVQKAEEFFEKAYNEAFEMLTKKMQNKEKFDLQNEEELFAVVVLFDNMIGFYKEFMFENGIALAETMIDLVDSPKLKEMFKGFSLGMEKGIDLNEFMTKYVDLSKIDPEFPMFLCNFKEEIKDLI